MHLLLMMIFMIFKHSNTKLLELKIIELTKEKHRRESSFGAPVYVSLLIILIYLNMC
jgi:hypothetical protein